MTMLFSGSEDYGFCEMYYAVKAGRIVRLEIYNNQAADIVDMYQTSGYTVTKARDTDEDVSSKFTEHHAFNMFP